MKIKGHLTTNRIVMVTLILIVVGGVAYFFLKIYPLLNPRMKML